MINNLRAFQEVLKRNNLPMPDTYLGISELIRSLYRPDVSPNPERIREVIEELTWPVTVPAGNPITFKSCSEVLASEAVVTFSPKQSGTGDPSPSNIRPISGWDSLHINRCDEVFVPLWTIDSNFDGTVAFNQLVKNGNFSDNTQWSKWHSTLTASNNEGEITITNVNSAIYQDIPNLIEGHKILVCLSAKIDDATNMLCLFKSSSFATITGTTYTRISKVLNVPSSGNGRLQFTVSGTTGQKAYIKNVMVIDLTQMFGSTIADYIYSLEQATAGSGVVYFRSMHPNDYYPYDTGTSEIVGTNIATANFPSTVYGGSYDFVSGKGTSEWGYIAEYDGETLPGVWMSDRDVYAEGTTPTTGAEVAYITNTPTPITLPPADVNLLKGSNTVWTDGDNVTVKFQVLK